MIDRDSLGHPRIYLNTGAGSLTVDTAAEAARDAQGRLNPMPGVVVAGEAETAALHARVRDLVADFLHARSGREISFHQSSTAALFDLAFALRGVLAPSANLVVTDLDHMANVSPWETVWGEGRGLEIRRARLTSDGHARRRPSPLARRRPDRAPRRDLGVERERLPGVPLKELVGRPCATRPPPVSWPSTPSITLRTAFSTSRRAASTSSSSRATRSSAR